MHATVRKYSGSQGLIDALVEHESEVREVITGIDGFRAYYLVDAGEGDAVSVSVYDTFEGAEESNRRAAEWLRENLPDLQVAAPDVAAGEVVIDAG
jgi:hypothetical protein